MVMFYQYSELSRILNELRDKERDYWMSAIKHMAKIGVTNTAILDLASGEVSGVKGSFVIDEKLLPKLQFIKNGEFSEIRGAPTLKLVGDVSPVSSGNVIAMNTVVERGPGIRLNDIINDFLDRKEVSNPIEYVSQICYESSGFLPVYYYIWKSGRSIQDIIEIVKKVPSRSPSKFKLIERLDGPENLHIEYKSKSTPHYRKTQVAKDELLFKKVPSVLNSEKLPIYLKAIRTLPFSEIDPDYLFPLLKEWFHSFYFGEGNQNMSDNIRRVICHVDYQLYFDR